MGLTNWFNPRFYNLTLEVRTDNPVQPWAQVFVMLPVFSSSLLFQSSNTHTKRFCRLSYYVNYPYCLHLLLPPKSICRLLLLTVLICLVFCNCLLTEAFAFILGLILYLLVICCTMCGIESSLNAYFMRCMVKDVRWEMMMIFSCCLGKIHTFIQRGHPAPWRVDAIQVSYD